MMSKGNLKIASEKGTGAGGDSNMVRDFDDVPRVLYLSFHVWGSQREIKRSGGKPHSLNVSQIFRHRVCCVLKGGRLGRGGGVEVWSFSKGAGEKASWI